MIEYSYETVGGSRFLSDGAIFCGSSLDRPAGRVVYLVGSFGRRGNGRQCGFLGEVRNVVSRRQRSKNRAWRSLRAQTGQIPAVA